MKILISNDDGWQAPGIVALAKAVKSFATIKVVAPDRNRSAASNSLTLTHPMRVTQQSNDWYSVDGTPADCIILALDGFLNFKPDMVISGINAGPNLGDDVLYSGTVAAAMEGYFHGYPSIAFSLASSRTSNSAHFDNAAKIAAKIVWDCKNNPLLKSCILNVNIPDINAADNVQLSVTSLGRRGRSVDNCVDQMDPRGEKLYWIGPVSEPESAGAGTDFYAINNDQVSISPITTDITAHDNVVPLSEILSNAGGAA